MGVMKLASLAAALLALLAPNASSQTHPGVTFDQNIRTVRAGAEGTDTATATIHVTATTSNIKLDITGRAAEVEKMPAAGHIVMLLGDGGAKMTFLVHEQKQYMTMNPIQMLEGMQKMMSGMGMTIAVDTALTKVTVDSLGPGPPIDGHSILRYRVTSRLHMSIGMMGETNEIDEQWTEEIDAAPDYEDLRQITSAMNKFTQMSETFGFAKDFFERVQKAHEKFHGFPLHMVKKETKTAGGQTETSTDTTTVSNIRRGAIADAEFVVPADYKAVSLPMFAPPDTSGT